MGIIKRTACFLIFIGATLGAYVPAAAVDFESDTWVATDALGRELPGYAECGPVRADRQVGIFYFLWLGQHGVGGPYNIPEILSQPDPKPWGKIGESHHWGVPELGYYTSTDQYVLRKHAQMLSNAGVDSLIFDTTNSYDYNNCYMTLGSVFQNMRDNGNMTPQFMFLTPWAVPANVVNPVYRDLYSQNRYPDLWFKWNNKPLILADSGGITQAQKDFFTTRKPMPSYYDGPLEEDQWGWLEVYPQHSFYNSAGQCEEVIVGVAQNGTNTTCSQMSVQAGIHGRSWHNGAKDTSADAVNYGYNFQEQWNRALALDPKFVFVTGWNEWVAQKFEGNVFWDCYDQEYSRDIEPMQGGHTDNYYYQMIANIRKYKGVRKPTPPSAAKTITIDGNFCDWADVSPEYKDPAGDTIARNSIGWGSAGTYTNNTGRNDFIKTKVARDADYIYFYVETQAPITPHTDPKWMLLYIDSDCNATTGWNGYDYIVNLFSPNAGTKTALAVNRGGCNWSNFCDVPYRVTGNMMELRIPRSSIGQNGPNTMLDFHWADNIKKINDITEFSVSGDSAPDRRFNYRYATATPGAHWEFRRTNDLEGWQAANSVANLGISGGNLAGDVVGADPRINGPRLPDIDADANHYIQIRLKSNVNGTAEFFWGTSAEPSHAAGREIGFEIKGDGEFHDYVIDMSANPQWKGLVNSLRFDLPDGNAHFEIDYIRILANIPSGSYVMPASRL